MLGPFIYFLLLTAQPSPSEAGNTTLTGRLRRLVQDVYFPLSASHLINTGATVSLKPSLLPLAWGRREGKHFLKGSVNIVDFVVLWSYCNYTAHCHRVKAATDNVSQ